MENTNQNSLPVQSSPQSQPSKNIFSNQRGNVPIIIGGVLLLLIIAGGAYYLGTRQNQPVQQQATTVPTDQSSPTAQPTQEANQNTSLIPNDWIYKTFADCGVRFPIPPKKEPYYSTPNPNRPPSVTNDDGSGRFWDFPRGVTSNLLSKFPNGYENHKQANAWYATAEEASGYVSSAVSVSCLPNTSNFNNITALSSLKAKLQEYNQDTGEKGMGASTYTVKSSNEVSRWNQKVYDLTVAEYYANPGGQPYTNNVEYTVFTTPKFIYEVRILGATENSFVKETANKIFDNLQFTSN